MYVYNEIIRLHQTDAAGIVFFSHLFVIAHNAYESFLDSFLPLSDILSSRPYMIPIVHAEADYQKPLQLSEKIIVEVSLGKLGTSSFSLIYVIKNSQSETAAQIETVHALRSVNDQTAIPIPQPLKDALEAI